LGLKQAVRCVYTCIPAHHLSIHPSIHLYIHPSILTRPMGPRALAATHPHSHPPSPPHTHRETQAHTDTDTHTHTHTPTLTHQAIGPRALAAPACLDAEEVVEEGADEVVVQEGETVPHLICAC
jgi:hypothetical protein